MLKYINFSILIILFTIFTRGFLQSKEKIPESGLLEYKQTKLKEENLTTELKIITREKSPLLIQNTRPIKQQFKSKVSITIGGVNGNLLYAKEVNKGSNLWLIDWIDLPDFKKPLGGINKNSNNYQATINIKNSFGDIEIIKMFIEVIDVYEDIYPDSKNLTTKKKSDKVYKNNFEGILSSSKNTFDYEVSNSLFESEKGFLNESPPLTSELKIVTKEHSPLLIQNRQTIRQEFNDKVTVSIGGEDGDLFFAKEVEEDSNLWHIDWINPPDYEKPLGGINNNSNNYKALINIKDSSENIETITLFVDVIDIDENVETVIKDIDSETTNYSDSIYSEIPKIRNKFFSLNNLSLGLAEKGAYLGLSKDFGNKNQMEFGYNYMNLDISRFFTTNSEVKIKNSSFKFALRRFLTENFNKEGFYIEGTGDLAKLNIYSDYLLTEEESSFGSLPLSVTCGGCGSLYVNLEDKFTVIPSILFGYRRNISKRLIFDFKAGVQYINMPKITWKAIQADGTSYYPPFIYSRIEREANDEVEILNNKLDKLPKILPTVGVNLIYKF